ncbi:GNAT family N-acetyltransferase [Shimia abyssi]|uniref:Ribosomal-protein-alanine N-acetyltransferase n=1 Tax=Shimia abyssi TaxID=1662395 RepID=A0A2P8FKH7_9RHOB|nr:GNAT family N-acetyltransferase [Shimia abyssi]PSL22209.1 ribosomal-protein-alanine N-acetyltransferase [Shimia abyssi]
MQPAILASLHAAAFTESRPWGADEFANLLASDLVLVVGDDTGFALGRVIVDECELLTIAVHPAAQRTGRGRTLLATFESTAQTKGAERVFLEVAADNTAARALYESSGYIQHGMRPAYYRRAMGADVAAHLMEKRLQPL